MEYQPMAMIPRDCSDMVRGYLKCAEWCGLVDDDQKQALELSVSPTWTEGALFEASEACAEFKTWAAGESLWETFEADESRAGHDLWLTRNRHGAGFWDGDWPAVAGKKATDWANTLGERAVWFDEDSEKLSFA